jgi:hypothetical protein
MWKLQFRFPVRVPSRDQLLMLGMGMKYKDAIYGGYGANNICIWIVMDTEMYGS